MTPLNASINDIRRQVADRHYMSNTRLIPLWALVDQRLRWPTRDQVNMFAFKRFRITLY
jgi:hypothetical protein